MDQIFEKLEAIDCKKDTKARRRLNDCGETVCNITPDQIEDGVTLEELENCNTPVHCYGGQLTIHGKMPGFNPNVRPGGYKALFLNGNGSIGVRYIAIDAGKKELISKAANLAKNGWNTRSTSQGFEISKSFYVLNDMDWRKTFKTDEEADVALKEKYRKAREDCLNCMKSVPTEKFFGGIACFSLAYGMGYVCVANIGAIPQEELWNFINQMFNIPNQEEIDRLQSIEDEKHKKYMEGVYASNAKFEKERKEELAEFLKSKGKPLFHIPMWQEFKFKRYVVSIYNSSRYDEKFTIISQYKGKWCYATVEKLTDKVHWSKWKELVAKTYLIWDQKIQQGLFFPVN